MSTEEKQNFQTFQDSSSTVYPKEEKEVSELIKQYYKSNIPIEIIGSGSKKKNRKTTSVFKNLKLIKFKWNCRIFARRALY